MIVSRLYQDELVRSQAVGYTPATKDKAPGSSSALLDLFVTVRTMQKGQGPTKDDVARLIRGKPSRGKVGSRQIRHRLRQDELERLAVARSRGYLTITTTTRAALQNAWHMDRLAASEPCVFVQHKETGYVISGEHESAPIKGFATTLEEVQEILRRHRS
jgi:hypothetical protein